MNRNISEKGQALILIAFGIVALIGFTALAIDGGRVFSDRRNAQNAADTAALAAALDEIYARYGKVTPGYEQTGLNRAADNYYQNDADHTVTVEFCDDARTAGDPCTGLPSGAVESEYIRVKIESKVHMTFARVLGREFVTNHVEAVSRVQGALTTNVFNSGAGLYATNMNDENDCFKVLGSAGLKLHDTGIYVGCKGNKALSFGGSADLYMDANAQVVGCTDDQDFPIEGTGTIDCGVEQQNVGKSTFADVPTAPPTPSCTGPGQKLGSTWTPGSYGSEIITSTITFQAGVYCFANLNVKPSGNIVGTDAGAVRLVLSNDIKLMNTGNDVKNLELFMNNADFDIFGSLNADRFRFYGKGNSSFSLASHATLDSIDAYIYSETGRIEFDAQADANLHAPPPDDDFGVGGILIYMPWDNPNDFNLNGGSDNTWYGTVLVPHAHVTYNGGSNFKLYGQVIGYTFTINGGNVGEIFFNSDVSYNPPNNPTIEFTK